MPALKNPKWELFAQELAKGKTGDESYVLAGYKENRNNASRLKANESILKGLSELQERGALRAAVTVASILDELDEALKLAQSISQPSAMIAASMGKAKVAGLLVDRNEHSGPDKGPIQTLEVIPVHERVAALLAIEAPKAEPGESSGRTH